MLVDLDISCMEVPNCPLQIKQQIRTLVFSGLTDNQRKIRTSSVSLTLQARLLELTSPLGLCTLVHRQSRLP